MDLYVLENTRFIECYRKVKYFVFFFTRAYILLNVSSKFRFDAIPLKTDKFYSSISVRRITSYPIQN